MSLSAAFQSVTATLGQLLVPRLSQRRVAEIQDILDDPSAAERFFEKPYKAIGVFDALANTDLDLFVTGAVYASRGPIAGGDVPNR